MKATQDVKRRGDRHAAGMIFGVLSLLCAVPDLTLSMAGDWFHYPDWLAPAVMWSVFISPAAGLVFAVLASRWNRWWLLLAAAWLGMLAYGWWYQSHHPTEWL